MSIKFSTMGHFKIMCTNKHTNKKECLYESSNLILDQFKYSLGFACGGPGRYEVVRYIVCGSGSTVPTTTDTALASKLWDAIAYSNVLKDLSEDMSTLSITHTFIIPASSSYVGTINELGLLDSNNKMVTRALLKDAEGNPYSINKTDLDQLTIEYTIDVSILSADGYVSDVLSLLYPTAVGSNEKYYLSLIAANNGGWSDDILMPCTTRHYKTVKNRKLYSTVEYLSYMFSDEAHFGDYADMIGGHSYSHSDPRWNKDTFTYTSAKLRVPRDCANLNGHYINFITVRPGRDVGVGIMFPNENIFPARVLSNMSVGTGDSITTEFKPPLNFWVRESESIYVNGVKQIRGTDYTIDHYNNLDLLSELFPSTHLHIISGGTTSPKGKSIESGRIYKWTKDTKTTYVKSSLTTFVNNLPISDRRGSLLYLDKDNPIIMEMPIDTLGLDWSVDTLYICTSYQMGITISYSDNLQDWHDICTNFTPNTNGNTWTESVNLSECSKVSFDAVIARYWRMQITNDSNLSNSSISNGVTFILRRDGNKLSFKQPPAEGALITMDASIDRPYKDIDHVLDFQLAIQY